MLDTEDPIEARTRPETTDDSEDLACAMVVVDVVRGGGNEQCRLQASAHLTLIRRLFGNLPKEFASVISFDGEGDVLAHDLDDDEYPPHDVPTPSLAVSRGKHLCTPII